ncbi:Sex hormone-binding globulin, partial [Galemys pyrenaicus]
SQDPPAVCLSNGPGQEPTTIMTFDLTKIKKTSSSFEIRTWDPEGVIFYGDTNPKEDFMLGLRDGRPEIQLHNQWAQLTVGAGPRLDDGRWHQMEVRIHGDSVLLEVDGDLVLSLRQVSGPLSDKPQPILRIALGGLLFPVSDLRWSLSWMAACAGPAGWTDRPRPQPRPPLASEAVLQSPSLGYSSLQGLVQNSVSKVKIFPSLRQSPGPFLWTWDSSWQQAQATSLPWALQKTLLGSVSSSKMKYSKVVLSSRVGTGPGLDLPLVLGLPLQLKLHESRVVLSQGPKKEILALPPLDGGSLLNLWVEPQGHLFFGTLPGKRGRYLSSSAHHWKQVKGQEKMGKGLGKGISGRELTSKTLQLENWKSGKEIWISPTLMPPVGAASSASFCLDGLWAQGQKLDIDQALNRSQDIWTHSCPYSLSNDTDTTH